MVQNVAAAINSAADWFRNTWEPAHNKAHHREALLRHVDKLDPIMRHKDVNGYSAAQRAYMVSGRTFGETLNRSDELFRQLVLADNPLDIGISSKHLGTPYLYLIQHVPITCMPVGTMMQNLKNNLNPEGDQAMEPDVLKIVFASLDSRGAILQRSWRGRLVPAGLVSFYPGATEAAVRGWLTHRRVAVEVSRSA